jgi:ABC-2 type transport system ATP-binding protein
VCLLGPNGSGKTTLLRILATAIAPTGGQALVCGHSCRLAPELVRRSIGYLPEALPVEPFARVEEYLRYRASLKGIARRQRAAEVDRCLRACDLLPSRGRFLERLALGCRRRVGLADALLGSPSVLLLDEPTLGLDPLQVVAFRDLLAREAARCTILLSTHLLAEAKVVCTRALILNRGRLLSDLPLIDALPRATIIVDVRAPLPQLAEAFLPFASREQFSVLSNDGLWVKCRFVGPPDLRESVARICHERGWLVRELRCEAGNLEEHFLRVAGLPRKEAA